jgi:hypothetical protein
VDAIPAAYPLLMNFAQGQRVRIRDKKLVGKVEKKLSSLDDVYVILFEDGPRSEEKLVRGADLEPEARLTRTRYPASPPLVRSSAIPKHPRPSQNAVRFIALPEPPSTPRSRILPERRAFRSRAVSTERLPIPATRTLYPPPSSLHPASTQTA